MITSHNVVGWQSEHDSMGPQGSIQRDVTLVTPHLITFTMGRETVTLRSESGIGGRGLPQKMIQSSARGLHPLDPDVDCAPAILELGPEQFGYGVEKIQSPSVAEVQARPHAGILA